MNMKKINYVTPAIESIAITVEQGFAATGTFTGETEPIEDGDTY